MLAVDYDLKIYTAYLSCGFAAGYAMKCAKEAFLQRAMDAAVSAPPPPRANLIAEARYMQERIPDDRRAALLIKQLADALEGKTT